MSLESIFTKSNLVYIPLSIAIAHTLNFITNSPSSTWQEFPPKLPDSVYSSILFTPLLLFISLSFEPIQTRTRFCTLLSLAIIFSSIPISFRGKYPPELQDGFVGFGALYGLKMLMFLKLNRAYLNQKDSEDQKKEFKPFLWTLFNWRSNSYIIPPKSGDSNGKENSLIIESPTTSQVNKKLIDRFIIIIVKLIIFELAFYIFLTKYVTEIPDKAYQIRLVEFITKGIPPITMSLMLQYLNAVIILYLRISLNYDIIIVVFTIFFRFLFHSTSEKDDHKPILIRLGLLTSSEFVDLNEWIISFVFNTKHMFNEPWMSSGPRDFWSTRWQSMFRDVFKELGYLPARNLFAPFVPKKIANMMGVLGAFGISALMHEYINVGEFDILTGEAFFFFMIHGVILVLSEAAFGYENKNENAKVKRFLKRILMLVIYLPVLPLFVEPLIRNFELVGIKPHFPLLYME